eukprot:CAMPEP_0168323548 /NCGR_PEP_ID=MMETSP0213-20121227/3545_1 /TAXON_ID=151035 /ORGANISM="Euplotes harpa, Strain FSP1.4" /LENGTH=142 /DNA_ID=CAMNT_0008325637 /DNA_START=38 /DNA_END=464 /DNA_ORIENTATION=+
MSESKGPALPVISTGESEINKSRRVEDDYMEQLKEDLKAKTHKGYIPRDIFAEDEDDEEKSKSWPKRNKEKQETQEPAPPVKPKHKRRRIDDDDESDDEPDIKKNEALPKVQPRGVEYKDGQLKMPLDEQSKQVKSRQVTSD